MLYVVVAQRVPKTLGFVRTPFELTEQSTSSNSKTGELL